MNNMIMIKAAMRRTITTPIVTATPSIQGEMPPPSALDLLLLLLP